MILTFMPCFSTIGKRNPINGFYDDYENVNQWKIRFFLMKSEPIVTGFCGE